VVVDKDAVEVARGLAAINLDRAEVIVDAQHLHVFSDDVGGVALDAVVVGVLAGLQAGFDHAWSGSRNPPQWAIRYAQRVYL
jgi:hypothetical protein